VPSSLRVVKQTDQDISIVIDTAQMGIGHSGNANWPFG
jgi:hypothetical protein